MAPRRKRRSRDEISRILQLYRDSGLTQRKFARRHRISAATLNNWLRRERPVISERPDHKVANGGVGSQLVPVSLPVGSFGRPDFELVLDGGLQLRIPPDFDPEALGSLLKVLAAC